MTAPDPRLEEIEGRQNSRYIHENPRKQMSADIAFLLAELRKAQDKLARVEGLAAEWEDLGGPGSDWERVYGKQKVSVDHAVARVRAAVADATGGGDS